MNQTTYLFKVNFIDKFGQRDYFEMRGTYENDVRDKFEFLHPDCRFINCSRVGN
jgi:hypothetical protein